MNVTGQKRWKTLCALYNRIRSILLINTRCFTLKLRKNSPLASVWEPQISSIMDFIDQKKYFYTIHILTGPMFFGDSKCVVYDATVLDEMIGELILVNLISESYQDMI